MIKFTNGIILDKDFNLVKTDVYVDKNKIVSVGDKELNADRVYDLKGNLFFRLRLSLREMIFTGFLSLHFLSISQAELQLVLICIMSLMIM